ncbi:MAG: phage tail protein [Sphingomonas sp.]
MLVDQLEVAGFTKVRGLTRETKVETFREGGVNDHEHKLASLTSYVNLGLERGLADPTLYAWHQAVVEGMVKRAVLTVTLRDAEGRTAWSWNVLNAYPVKWTVSDFDRQFGPGRRRDDRVRAYRLSVAPRAREHRTVTPRLPWGSPARSPRRSRRRDRPRRPRGGGERACRGGGPAERRAGRRRIITSIITGR